MQLTLCVDALLVAMVAAGQSPAIQSTPTPTTSKSPVTPAPATAEGSVTPALTPATTTTTIAAVVTVVTTPIAPVTWSKCTEVSVERDATYCIQGPVCSGADDAPVGSKCPKEGDAAKKDCSKTLASYADGGKCVAPVDAKCVKIQTGAWGCVFPSTPAPGATPATAATATTTPCPVISDWQKPTPTPSAPTTATLSPVTSPAWEKPTPAATATIPTTTPAPTKTTPVVPVPTSSTATPATPATQPPNPTIPASMVPTRPPKTIAPRSPIATPTPTNTPSVSMTSSAPARTSLDQMSTDTTTTNDQVFHTSQIHIAPTQSAPAEVVHASSSGGSTSMPVSSAGLYVGLFALAAVVGIASATVFKKRQSAVALESSGPTNVYSGAVSTPV